ncbi:uncharacterized protein EDB91DRAFT_63179 [Suillus paluster]|uniref:uncharacterized protein n=1 Tax=Suillus paluster TaxID=48578 RepID=UPI001B861F66|nr:uncharacterized protein EDB91DRAFT_63179 [Suillus paluster]KAG1726047.1 hypothetical protein EDB91DRAFT_63179 [Suillus paluster]
MRTLRSAQNSSPISAPRPVLRPRPMPLPRPMPCHRPMLRPQVDDDPIIAGLIFAEKFMGEYPNTDYIIDDILEAKELFERGMENVPDGVIVEAIFTKLADRKAKNARALASLWEAEAIERHGVLLHKLRKANAQMYADNPAEASRIESVLVRCSVKELQDDLEASNLAYCYDKGAAAVADLHFEVLKELAASRNLNLSGKRSKDALQAKLVEGGNSFQVQVL